ncbi:MAG: dihydroxyacetone kinase-like protein [Verrucomicrobiales bacterium]|jgi:dihydroxyacetone kinase-like protein
MPKETLTPAEAKAMLHRVADAIIEAEPLLSQADRDLGDGDHGLGMARGMRAAKEALDAEDFAGVDKVFAAVGSAMMSSMGGASGVVFGSMFKAGGKAMKGEENLTSAGIAATLSAAAEVIQKRGGAKAGDKTMLDALIPAGDKAAEVSGQPLHTAVAAIADAAEAGKDASKPMIATMGRAKTLGERSIGFPDAGAISVAIILRTMSDYLSSD